MLKGINLNTGGRGGNILLKVSLKKAGCTAGSKTFQSTQSLKREVLS